MKPPLGYANAPDKPSDVSHVMVASRLLMWDGKLLTLDEERIVYEAEKRARRMVGQDLRTYDLRIIDKDGNARWLGTSAVLITWEGRPAVLSFLSDITERKRAEEALRESEEKYRLLVETANEAIVVAQDGMLKFSNPRLREISGYSQEEAASRPFAEFIHPDDLEMAVEYHLKCLQGEETPQTYDLRVIDKDGNTRWLTSNTVLITWEGRPAALNLLSDITERKRAEEALRERVKELTCLYAVHRDTQKQLSIDELCRRVIEHLVPAMEFPEITVPVIELDGRRFTSERYTEDLSHGLQAEIIVGGRADGKLWVYYAEDRPFLIPEEQNLVNGVAEALGGWLERKQAEETLRESEERYHALFDGVPVGLYRSTPDGQILDANLAAMQMMGYPDLETMLAVNAADGYANPEDRVQWQALMDREGLVHDFEVQWRRHDGTIIWVKDAARAVRDADGRMLYYEGSMENITKRVRAEAEIHRLYEGLQRHTDGLEDTVAQRTRELQAERDLTRSILETLGEAVVVADLEGTVLYTNPAAVALAGLSVEGQQRLWQSDYQPEEVYNQIQDTLRSGQRWRGETVNKRRDGTLYDAAVTVAPLFDPHDPGQPIGSVYVERDITPLKEAERFKDQFISNVSHELRTPLSVITLVSGALDNLYERLDDDRRRKMIRDIRRHSQVLDNLIGDVLEISRIDSKRISREHQRVNLAQMAREEVDEQLPLAREKSQTLRVTGVEHLAVWGNGGQLRQVIRNLLNNAIKFTPDEGRITCEHLMRVGGVDGEGWPGSADLPAGRWAALRVVDTGIGIRRKDLPHVFQRFYRVQAQGNIPGTGLGLAIVRELVELHDGHVAVASTLGKGSTFAIYLPLRED